MDFFPEIDVSALEAEALARGLFAVAAVDGVHERELALISDFYQAAIEDDGGVAAATISSLERSGAIEPDALAGSLPTEGHRQLFVKTALLVAFADGAISAKERAKIGSFAQALSIDAASLARLEAEVKDYLLRPLAGLANVEAVAEIAKKLGV